MIPQSFIQELLTRVDVVDVVGKAVKLRKAGANYQGLCPFHNEKTPSFSVSPTKQFYHCFGCGAHGSAISFLMEHHGLGFVEAVHELARDVGLTVPEDHSREGAEAARKASQQLALSQWLDQAARYYRSRLKETPAAITYLKERGVTGETARHFGLGYAPAGWRNLEGVLPDYAAEDAVRAGLVIAGEDGKRYDRFRERIMFPIRNPRGQVIGFGGRVLGQGEPKYLNSPEGPLFSKGHELYGLFEAREGIRASGRVLVVEGYMDVVMLHQHGCQYAVATLGTATTATHLGKLLRLADRVVFSFDGDAAGRRAAWRALENALPLLSDTKQLDFLFLPPEHDPDSFVRAEGLEAFEACVRDALPLSSFLLKELAQRADITTPEGRARMQAELKPLVQQMPDIALRTQILVDMAGRLGLPTEELAAYCGLQMAHPVAHVREGGGRHGGRAVGGDARSMRSGTSRTQGASLRDQAAPADGRFWREASSGRWQGGGNAASRRVNGPSRRDEGYDRAYGGGSQGGARMSGAVRSRPAPPTLQQRMCLLLAYYPALAQEPLEDESLLPQALLDWRNELATLPAGAHFASVLAEVRATDPRKADFIESLDQRDAGVMAAMDFDAARTDYMTGLDRMRLEQARRELLQAVQGLDEPGGRTRYEELNATVQRLSQRGTG
ncbi:MAG: DNA primase [Lautropia mirabilis]